MSEIVSRCRECIFYTGQCLYDDRLNKFRERREVVESEDGPEVQRFCTSFRPQTWRDREENKGKKILDIEEEIRTKLSIQADILIDAVCANFDDVVLTMNSIMSQDTRPERIVVGVTHKIDMYQILELMNKVCCPHKIKYQIINIKEELLNDNRRVSILADKCEKPYFCYYMAGTEVPDGMLDELSRCVNDDLRKITMICPYNEGSLDGLIIQRNIHKAFKLDDGHSIVDKVKFLAKEQGLSEMVLEWQNA